MPKDSHTHTHSVNSRNALKRTYIRTLYIANASYNGWQVTVKSGALFSPPHGKSAARTHNNDRSFTYSTLGLVHSSSVAGRQTVDGALILVRLTTYRAAVPTTATPHIWIAGANPFTRQWAWTLSASRHTHQTHRKHTTSIAYIQLPHCV